LFGNFVFLGIRYNSGIKHRSDIDLYLRGEDGLQYLTDYNCSFVVENRTLCSANHYATGDHPTYELRLTLQDA